MSALVLVRDGEVRANSRDVAASFSKEHRHVLRAIDGLISSAAEAAAHFWATDYQAPGASAQRHRAYEMDRDGFALLAMGFTGPKALRWKLAYIDAFNRMEAALRDAAANDPEAEPSAAELDAREAWRTGLQLVREARIIGGRAAARRAWTVAGLPDVFGEPETALAIEAAGVASVRSWAAARMERSEGARTKTMALHADYLAWCAEHGEDPASVASFSRELARMGIAKIKSNGIYQIGVKLKE